MWISGLKGLITKCVCCGMPGPHTTAVAKISCCWAVCEESHFYSLPFGQAEANIYLSKHHFN